MVRRLLRYWRSPTRRDLKRGAILVGAIAEGLRIGARLVDDLHEDTEP